MITIHRWDGTNCKRSGIEQLPDSVARIGDEEVIWIDLSDPTPEEEAAVFNRFLKVHPLTLEDVTKLRREPEGGAHFPKVEEFPDYLFVVVNPLPPGLAAVAAGRSPSGDGVAARTTPSRMLRRRRPQLCAAITRNALVTHSASPLECVTATHRFLDSHGDCAGRGPDYLFHIVLDMMVDEYAPVVDWIAGQLDRVETRIFTHPTRTLLSRILKLKRLVTAMRKTLIHEREVLSRLIRGEFKLVEPPEMVYYRNVHDHLVRYSELIETAREMVSDLAETHLAAVSNRLNEIMKVLAMISTIVLPMTLIAGIYGMNFEENVLPNLKSGWGFWAVLSAMALTGVGSVAYFRWRRWI